MNASCIATTAKRNSSNKNESANTGNTLTYQSVGRVAALQVLVAAAHFRICLYFNRLMKIDSNAVELKSRKRSLLCILSPKEQPRTRWAPRDCCRTQATCPPPTPASSRRQPHRTRSRTPRSESDKCPRSCAYRQTPGCSARPC